ncbi:hypothetical protein [Kitasatospora sp. NPDC094016]|uniref:hypothetical protein n=1 Tax=Kitasatospora sp. NPDC094016 TaxID=3154986 RepID=UPI00332D6FBF
MPDDPTTAADEATEEAALPEPETEDAETSYSGFIHFRGAGSSRSPLQAQMPFILYWKKKGESYYDPVGLVDNKDMSPKSEVHRDDVLQFRFGGIRGENLTGPIITGPDKYWAWDPSRGLPLEFREGAWGSWSDPIQRKGQNFYLAAKAGGTPMSPIRRVNRCHAYGDGVRFALRMDIQLQGDAWISDEHTTGSIRMQNPEARRAYLVAVRYGTDFDDPFGSQTVFRRRTDLP